VTNPGLFFDARYIRVDFHDGISRFSAELCRALSAITPVTAIISDSRQLESLPTGIPFVTVNAPTSALEPLVALKLNRLGAKVVFSPMQTMGTLGRRFRLILTIHDLIYYRHKAPPAGFSLPVRALWRLYHLTFWPQRWLLAGCDSVVTVSYTTKRLIHQYRLTSKPVDVVGNAAGTNAEQAVLPQPKARPVNQRLIYMGSFMGYKNVETLIAGMQWLPDYELHLLSKIKGERLAQLQALVPSGAKVVFHNGVSDLEYYELLSSAVALVSASLDEGFGIPVIEAHSRGIPTVLSDLEIFREIGGDASVYFDTADAKAFAAAVEKLNTNEAWMRYSRASKANSNRYNWDASAKALLKALEPLMQQAGR
jgi:glycosyltransferase involved in cell wall biosynthesis